MSKEEKMRLRKELCGLTGEHCLDVPSMAIHMLGILIAGGESYDAHEWELEEKAVDFASDLHQYLRHGGFFYAQDKVLGFGEEE